jgi:hypothetical protein
MYGEVILTNGGVFMERVVSTGYLPRDGIS